MNAKNKSDILEYKKKLQREMRSIKISSKAGYFIIVMLFVTGCIDVFRGHDFLGLIQLILLVINIKVNKKGNENKKWFIDSLEIIKEIENYPCFSCESNECDTCEFKSLEERHDK